MNISIKKSSLVTFLCKNLIWSLWCTVFDWLKDLKKKKLVLETTAIWSNILQEFWFRWLIRVSEGFFFKCEILTSQQTKWWQKLTWLLARKANKFGIDLIFGVLTPLTAIFQLYHNKFLRSLLFTISSCSHIYSFRLYCY
jgi:hypothetical protein